MQCPSCAKDNDLASAYCGGCGATLPTHGGGQPAPYGTPQATPYEAPYDGSYGQPASYAAPAAFEMPAQSGPGWLGNAQYPDQPSQPEYQPQAYPQPEYQPEGYQPQGYQPPPVPASDSPPYADNAGPGYPTWMSVPAPTSAPPPTSGAPVSPGYPATPYDPNAYGQPSVLAQPGVHAQPAGYGPYAPQPQVISNAPPARRSGVWPVVAVAVVVVLAVGGFAAYTLVDHKKTPPVAAASTGPGTTGVTTGAPQPSATTDHNITATTAPPDPAAAHNQAAAIDSLLTASVNSRRKLNDAIDKVNRCSDLQGAVEEMNAAGQERQSQLGSAKQADLSAVPTGGQVRDLLVQALQYSQQADASYTAWAQGALENGCADSDQRDRDYAEGQRLSGLAKQAKTSFLAAWNPVASANGVSARSPDDI